MKEYFIATSIAISLGILFILTCIAPISLNILDSKIKSLSVQESLDITESRQREEKLAEYCKTLEYQIEVLSTKGLK